MFVDDEVGTPFFDILEQQAKVGVQVIVIVDSLGSFWLSRKRIKSLKSAGVDLRFFDERKKWYRGKWKQFWTRTHRKILVVDEEIGFIGGVNIGKAQRQWHDIHIRLTGNAVRSLLRAFAKNYLICGGDKATVKHLFQFRFRVQEDLKNVEMVFDEGHSRVSHTRKKHSEALLKARERVILFSPYYFPDRKFLKALWTARKRGVRIDLLIPFRTDVRIATYATYGLFELLKKRGVHVHLLKTMMHGKGVIMDDEWAMVGTSNLDKTSFYDNYEANIKIHDKKFVRKLKTTVLGWMKDSTALENMSWEKRGRWHRVKEWLAAKAYWIWYRKE